MQCDTPTRSQSPGCSPFDAVSSLSIRNPGVHTVYTGLRFQKRSTTCVKLRQGVVNNDEGLREELPSHGYARRMRRMLEHYRLWSSSKISLCVSYLDSAVRHGTVHIAPSGGYLQIVCEMTHPAKESLSHCPSKTCSIPG